MEIEVDAEGVARRPGSCYLAGSTATMPQVCRNLAGSLGKSSEEINRLTSSNPRRAIGLSV
jgi:N-acetylglucosamine-6-phosphate deacetylase